MNKKELIEIIEGCVINSQVLTEERVCFDELRKELNEELPEQLILSDVVVPKGTLPNNCKVCARTIKEMGEMTSMCGVSACPNY